MVELGSEFDLSLDSLSRVENNLFSYLSVFGEHVELFDSGRSAIRFLASSLKGKILLPEYICESVISCFDIHNVTFYKVHKDFSIDLEDLEKKISPCTVAIFLMHYFGAVQNDQILSELKAIAEERGLVIIEDTTQSLFSKKNTIGDYMVSSIRKWMPIPKGGVLYYSKDRLGLERKGFIVSKDNERIAGMVLKNLFLKDELDCNAEYRKIFSCCEDRLDEQQEIFLISDLSRFIISCIDIGSLVEKRRTNYRLLKDYLGSIGVEPAVKLSGNECPFVLPIRIPDRDKFRNYLMDNRVYCAVHWPSDGIREEERSQFVENYSTLISLPIDQRYDEEHLQYLISIIDNYRGNLKF